jgi:hypothetical protein
MNSNKKFYDKYIISSSKSFNDDVYYCFNGKRISVKDFNDLVLRSLRKAVQRQQRLFKSFDLDEEGANLVVGLN